jgi:lipopolysaccharide transport system permease protein
MQDTSLTSAWRYRDLVRHLVLRDLRHKYKGSRLGFLWSLLNPLLMAAVYTVAFRYIVRLPIERFPEFLLSGLLPWTFFATGVSGATASVADNGALVRKVAFPRVVLPVSAVLSQFVQFASMYAVIVLVLLYDERWLAWALLALVPLALLQLVFTQGLGLALATAYVYARDTRHLLEVALQIGFWLTPVVYSMALVPARFRPIMAWNPMAQFVTTYQQIVVDGLFPGPRRWLVLAGIATAAALAGLAVFKRYERWFAERV